MMNEPIKTWCSIELNDDNAEIFRHYLKENDIYFEPSGCYELVHFECLMTNDECKAANEFLHNNIFEGVE